MLTLSRSQNHPAKTTLAATPSSAAHLSGRPQRVRPGFGPGPAAGSRDLMAAESSQPSAMNRALKRLSLTLILMLVGAFAVADEVRITKVPTQGLYTMRSHTYGDHLNKSSTLWAVRSAHWEGLRRAFCIEPGIPLTSGPHQGRLVEIHDTRVREALSLAEQLPADLAHAVALEVMAEDDFDLRTGETRFAVPREWGRIERADATEPVWRLELPNKQNLVVFGGPWDGKSYQTPVYPISSPILWWRDEAAWRPLPILGSYYSGTLPSGAVSARDPSPPVPPPPLPPSVVPLPPALWLFAGGLIGLMTIAVRRGLTEA